jgi:hypothetical protein
MSIFGIIGICLFICGCATLIGLLPCLCDDYWDWLFPKIFIPVMIALFIGAIFIGIGINTENEKVFVKKYLAQKETIEASLEVEELSGLERIELVKQATELNGELAEKKARFDLWHFVVYDNTIYDNVEFINLNRGNKNG